MIFRVKLTNIWIFIILTLLLFFPMLISGIINYSSELSRIWLIVLTSFWFFISLTASALISSSEKIIELNDRKLRINNRKEIDISEIEWYFEEKNYLLDGIRLKTKSGSNIYLTSLVLFNQNDDFRLLKHKILSRNSVSRETNIERKELKDFKYLRVIAFINVLLILSAYIFSALKTENNLLRISFILIVLLISGLIYMKNK